MLDVGEVVVLVNVGSEDMRTLTWGDDEMNMNSEK